MIYAWRWHGGLPFCLKIKIVGVRISLPQTNHTKNEQI